ncbi:MAG: restriction endonuclease [Acidobacteria bacterium]|nr:restriction endonuclease [Acidobacteriota bacterium]
MNTLYYGDNLKILREYIKDESVDLIYLDPPFNSNRNYNVLFKDESGTEAQSQITAFEDTWRWSIDAEEVYHELINEPDNVGRMIESFRQFIGTNQMMAYLVMMAIRLKELHRVLKPTGSLYLHCDPTASHYLKILLDTIFGAQQYINEIVWKRSDAHNDAKQGATHFGRIHDVIFFYSKTSQRTWNQLYLPLPQKTVDSWYRNVEPETGRRYNKADLTAAKPGGDTKYEWKGVPPPEGRYWAYSREKMEQMDADGRLVYSASGRPYMKRYLDESRGVAVQDFWSDIDMLRGISGGDKNERLGYPTQKPVALLERIISASSNEGDVVLDPFCGCGTTISAAQKLNREWIGIDVTHLSVGLMKYRLRQEFGILPFTGKLPFMPSGLSGEISTGKKGDSGLIERQAYRVIGQPEDLAGAKELADKDKYGFQWWILPLIGARAVGAEKGQKEGKKGADKGIDGRMVFTDDTSGKSKHVIISVKGGQNVSVSHIRDLVGTVEREKAAIGIYLTLEPPTKPMEKEAAEAGFYHSEGWNKDYPKIQILTVEDILNGKQPDLPPSIATFKQAAKVSGDDKSQNQLFE